MVIDLLILVQIKKLELWFAKKNPNQDPQISFWWQRAFDYLSHRDYHASLWRRWVGIGIFMWPFFLIFKNFM